MEPAYGDGVFGGVDFGAFDAAEAYPAAPELNIKQARLEALLSKPVKLTGLKRKNKGAKASAEHDVKAPNQSTLAEESPPVDAIQHAAKKPRTQAAQPQKQVDGVVAAGKEKAAGHKDKQGKKDKPASGAHASAGSGNLEAFAQGKSGKHVDAKPLSQHTKQPSQAETQVDEGGPAAQASKKHKQQLQQPDPKQPKHPQSKRQAETGVSNTAAGKGGQAQAKGKGQDAGAATAQTVAKGKDKARQQQQQQQQHDPQNDMAHAHPGSKGKAQVARAKVRPEAQQPATQQQAKGKSQDQAAAAPPGAAAAGPSSAGGMSSKGVHSGGGLLDKMRARLAGGRFRSLNESLYTCKGDEAYTMMQSDPSLFQQYHEGFRQQTKGWPASPVQLAARWLAQRPQELVVADFGCGDGELALTVKQKVHSFDLVSAAPHVVACNMASVPLPDASVDVAVFSLALMGTDYGAFLVEATRVLRHKGWLWLAEVRSRFAPGGDGEGGGGGGGGKGNKGTEDLAPFIKCLARLGYQVQSLDAKSNTMFFVAVLRKVNTPGVAPDAIKWPSLHACVYKKR